MSTTLSATALVVVDVQNDFCPGGSLATDLGDKVAQGIAGLLSSADIRDRYAAIVATQDWHIDPGSHFSDDPDFVDSWPVHCVAGTEGAALREPIEPSLIDEFFRKGAYTAAYSGFEAVQAAQATNDSAAGDAGSTGDAETGTPLMADWLREKGIDSIEVCGIATDHCVRATVLDGLKEGFAVTVLSQLCSPVDTQRGDAALDEMKAAGATVI
ncbi:isochorismatase family protein [Corynebacterium aquatimens]|uniref:nicotinamidase n=1 Tax=Corynebacterium aquatimens TaxID=1190508 RepID=A0A931E1L7_9CORY|nr:isochorismatase family protein [Corynebacterium aquatimens]MBG6122227.1 nicotinamidase/pyrazinamidase [Corynebacterium aquatimens]WJY65232.1 nicotinamidase/pyrazinamidase [Corynebacterium aquatimens]